MSTATNNLDLADMTPQERMNEYGKLEEDRRELEAKLEEHKERMRVAEEMLLEDLSTLEKPQWSSHGFTFFRRTDRYVSKRADMTQEEVCEALKQQGLGYMVKEGYNAATLKSKVKEWTDAGEEIPPPLAGMLNIGETVRLGCRKS